MSGFHKYHFILSIHMILYIRFLKYYSFCSMSASLFLLYYLIFAMNEIWIHKNSDGQQIMLKTKFSTHDPIDVLY